MVLPFPGPTGAPPGAPPPPPPGALPPTPPLWQMIPQELLTPDWGVPINAPAPPAAPPPPSTDDILSLADRLKSDWQGLTQRMQDDDNLYNMTDADTLAGSTVVSNLPYTVVEKIANMVGSQNPVISVVPPHLDLAPLAQKEEDLLRHLWHEWDRNFRRGGNTGLGHGAVSYAALRGMMAARVQYNPYATGPEIPVQLRLVDPISVFPDFVDDDISSLIYREYRYITQIRGEWAQAQQVFAGRQGNERVEVIAYYDRYYYAIFADSLPVVPPTAHNYGFVPWVVVTPNGSPARGSGQNGSGTTWVQNVAPSMFHSIKSAYQTRNRVLSQLYDIVGRAANPPIAVYYHKELGEPEQVSLDPGATNYFIADKERAEIIHNIPEPQVLGPLLAALDDDITMGSIPKVLWGGADPNQSGLAISLLSGAARDALFGIISSMEFLTEEINRMALTLIRDLHPNPVGIIVRDASGQWVSGETITPQEIAQVGVISRCTYKDVSPKDQFQMMQMAIALTNAQLISKETAREDYLGIESPSRENSRVINELVYQDPTFMKSLMIPYVMQTTNPQAWELYQLLLQQQSAPSPLSAPGSLAGVPGAPGSPPTPLPAQFGALPFDALQHSQASAQGGAGAQRPPGTPSLGGLIPGGLGVR